MADFKVTLDDSWIGSLQSAVDDAGIEGMKAVGDLVADRARKEHTFSNRTGDLQASIVTGSVSGRVTQGTLKGEVVAETDYAQFVEERWNRRWQYLQPAWDASVSDAEREMERAFQRAMLRV